MRRYKNYITEVTCFNCRNQMRIKIPIWQKVADTPCPKCGTKELVSGHVTWN